MYRLALVARQPRAPGPTRGSRAGAAMAWTGGSGPEIDAARSESGHHPAPRFGGARDSRRALALSSQRRARSWKDDDVSGGTARRGPASQEKTLRTDRWWLYPLTVFVVFTAFVVYATIRRLG